MLSIGQIISLHKLANINVDKSFKTINGRVEYDAIDYPNNASGWWVKVSRMTPNGVKVRSMHTDTEVVVTEIRTRSGKTVDFFDKEVRRKDALGLL
jgi:hypothetical protein